MSDTEAYPYRFAWVHVDNADAQDPVYMLSDVAWWDEAVTADTNLYPSEGVIISDMQRRGSGFFLQVENTTEETGAIQFPVWNYYGYTAKGDHVRFDLSDSGSGKIVALIPASYTGSLTLSFREPWYWRLAEAVSVVTLFVCLMMAFVPEKHLRTRRTYIRSLLDKTGRL